MLRRESRICGSRGRAALETGKQIPGTCDVVHEDFNYTLDQPRMVPSDGLSDVYSLQSVYLHENACIVPDDRDPPCADVQISLDWLVGVQLFNVRHKVR